MQHQQNTEKGFQDDWGKKITSRLGDAGEKIIDNYLAEKGFMPYKPALPGSHLFDRLVTINKTGKVFVLDVKTKRHRKYRPDTGIQKIHFDKYRAMFENYGIDTYLVFVDSGIGEVYGQWLSKLVKPRVVNHRGRELHYPRIEGPIIYFALESLKLAFYLTAEQIELLESLSSRNY